MKRDVTLNGERTKTGAIQDAVAFVRRYYANNYRDQYKQIALDMLLGADEDDFNDYMANVVGQQYLHSASAHSEEAQTNSFAQSDENDIVELIDNLFNSAIDDLTKVFMGQ